jgi:hypothetical protein
LFGHPGYDCSVSNSCFQEWTREVVSRFVD